MPQEQSFHLPLRASQIDQYDQTCKHLFSQKVILAYILRDYVPGFENCSIQQMMNDYLHDPMEADPFTNALTGMTNDRGHLRYDLCVFRKDPGRAEDVSECRTPGVDKEERGNHETCSLL